MTKRLAIRRIAGAVFVIACIFGAVYSAFEAVNHNAKFQSWLVAQPLCVEIDLSQPSETTAPFRQTCSISHGEIITLDCKYGEVDPNPSELLDGLEGVVVISDAEGNQVSSTNFSDKSAYVWYDRIALADVDPFATGDYIATIHVHSGAPALVSRKQTLIAEYQLCGLEQFPTYIARGLACIFGGVGLISLLIIAPVLYRDGIWRQCSPS